MSRRTSVALAILIACIIGALLARSCYPSRPRPLPRTPVSTASTEAPFPEPDVKSLHGVSSDFLAQLNAIKAALAAGGSPAGVSADFENAAKIAAELEARVGEIVSRLGANPALSPEETAELKRLAQSLRDVNRNLIPAARAAIARGDRAAALKSIQELTDEVQGVSERSAVPDGQARAFSAGKAGELKTTGEYIYAKIVKPDEGSTWSKQVAPLVSEAARQISELETALRAAAGSDPAAAAALKALLSSSESGPGVALSRIARAARAGRASEARSAARAFVRSMKAIQAMLVGKGSGTGAGWDADARDGTGTGAGWDPNAKNGAGTGAGWDNDAKNGAGTGKDWNANAKNGAGTAAGWDSDAAKAAAGVSVNPKFDSGQPTTTRRPARARPVPSPSVKTSAAAAENVESTGGPVRPKVAVHPELIPKNIHIVRVYYRTMIAGPGDTIEFDINGSGFTKDFEQAITVQSSMKHVTVENFSLVTPNQIHGKLVSAGEVATGFAFPTVSIGDNVVFQAAEPYAFIRPDEVLNLVFTEMGESGRSGRFRVFTNLTDASFARFHVEPSTPAISLGNFVPRLPFIVDGSIQVGPAVTGTYGVRILLDERVLWQRDGIIRIVNPNVGQTGLVLQIHAEDGFHRPGDVARFLVQGSGFQGSDAAQLSADVINMQGETASFTYLAPGRMSLDIQLPKGAEVGTYAVAVKNGASVLLNTPSAFQVVPPNWLRSVSTTPPLRPGGKAQLVLQGRSLQKEFVEGLRVVVDEPGLKIGGFQRVSSIQASADISADSSVRPGDYQVRIRSGRLGIVPETGDIIRILPAD